MKCAISIIPCQFLTKGQDKATVEASKVEKVKKVKKVENLKVGGCSKNTLQGWLQVTGQLLTVKDIRKGFRKSML